MKSEALGFEAAVEALLKAREPEDHPSPEELIGYAEGTLSAPERERLAGHLALCSRCSEAVLDLSSFPEVPLRESSTAAPSEEGDWQAVRARLEQEGELQPEPSRFLAFGPLARMAAAFLLGVLVMGAWMGRPDGDDAPVLSQALVKDLFDSRSRSRSLGRQDLTTVPAGEDRVLWMLNPYPGATDGYTAFEGEVATAGPEARVLWSRSLTLQDSAFALVFSRERVPQGRYVIRVFGLDEGVRTPEPLAQFEQAVEYLPD